MIYRYVLHLESSNGRRTIRWTFTHPISECETIEIPTLGRWYVSRVVTEDGSDSGVLYCTEPP